jgi:hypothetical protein
MFLKINIILSNNTLIIKVITPELIAFFLGWKGYNTTSNPFHLPRKPLNSGVFWSG